MARVATSLLQSASIRWAARFGRRRKPISRRLSARQKGIASRFSYLSPKLREVTAPQQGQPTPNVRGAKTAEVNVPAESETVSPAHEPLDAELEAALNAPRLPQYEAASSLQNLPPDHPLNAVPANSSGGNRCSIAIARAGWLLVQDIKPLLRKHLSGASGESLERWQPGEEPMIITPGADPEMKVTASLPVDPSSVAGGESVADKGQVNAGTTKATNASRASWPRCEVTPESREMPDRRDLFRGPR